MRGGYRLAALVTVVNLNPNPNMAFLELYVRRTVNMQLLEKERAKGGGWVIGKGPLLFTGSGYRGGW